MDLDAYIAERRGEWARLEMLTRRHRLTAAEADELVLLHQRVATHLSVIRSRAPDSLLLTRLSRLVLASRSAVTGAQRFSFASVGRFLTIGLPAELYRSRWWWIGVSLISVVLTGVLMQYVADHPEFAAQFLDEAQIRALVEREFVGYYSEYQAQNFAAQVWTNNALIAAQCLAAGVLIVPVLYVLITNLFGLGLTGGVMIGAGAGDTFFAYLTPHGLLELTAVFVASGAGLRIGWAWIAPGPERTRGQALVAEARSGMVIAVGLALVLLVAGLVEAFVTPAPLPTAVRIGIGAVVWLLFLAYALGTGAAAHQRDQSRPAAFSLR